MGRFFNPDKLTVEYIDGKDWTLINRDYGWGYETNAHEWIIPTNGFSTDFATIEYSAAWVVVGPPTGYGKGMNYGPAAIIHDFLYEFGFVFKPGIGNVAITRKEADLILLEAMEYLYVDKWRRNLMYGIVRMFGGSYWRNHEKDHLI
jgi:hypothetical protein